MTTNNGVSSMQGEARKRFGSAAILPLLFALLPPIGIYAALGVAPFLAVAALVVLVLDGRRVWTAVPTLKALIALVGALALWATASALWSILPAHSFAEGARLLTIGASGLILVAALGTLTDAERERLLSMTAISAIATVAVFVTDMELGFPMLRAAIGAGPDQAIPFERFDRGTTVLGLLFWSMAFGLWRSKRYGLLVAMTAAIVVALVTIPSSTNRLAALIGVAAWLLAWRAPRFVAAALVAGTVLLTVALPIVMPRILPTNESIVAFHDDAPWLKHSALHRFLIWRFVSLRIDERPWLGWGMDASRELPGGHEKVAAELSKPIIPPMAEAISLHPHNAALQWRVELGVPGVVLCLGIVTLILWRVGFTQRRGRAFRATALACAASALTIAMLGYGIWQAWWLSCLWIVAALLAPTLLPKPDQPQLDQRPIVPAGNSAFRQD
jgi:O-antigen ligase